MTQGAAVASSRKHAAEAPVNPLQGYQVIKLLSQGAEAKVYLLAMMTSGQLRVLKKPRTTKNYLKREFELLDKIREKGECAHVVETIMCSDEGMVLEWAPIDLFGLLEQKGALGSDTVLRLAAHMCRGLQAIHGIGYAHMDIKPENILVFFTANYELIFKLTDLGLATPLDKTVDDKSGSPAYAAPELMTVEPITIQPSCDMFSLGVTLFVASTARFLWETCGDENYQRFWKASDEIRFRGLDDSVVSCLKSLLCLNPQERCFPDITVISN